MKGRIEHDNAINAVVSNLIRNYPDYMQDYIRRFSSRTASTKENYVRKVIDFLKYVEADGRYDIDDIESLAKIRTSYINGYMETIKKLAPVTRANKLAAIKDFFDFLIEDEYISVNPCDRVKPPKVEEDIHVVSLNPGEINHMKDRIKNGSDDETPREKARREKWRTRDLAIITVGFATGLRVSSITEINLEDIDFDRKVITVVVKGNKTREIDIGDQTIEAIKNWIEDRNKIMIDRPECSALFISNQKKRISTDAVSMIVARGSADIDKHITPHKMRSSCGTNLYEATGDIYLVQTVLGHSNIKNTRRYTNVSDERKKNAANILDNLF